MKSKKIVFILSSFHIRCVKRIKEFIKNGYDVDIYGFRRDNTTIDLEATIIGDIIPHSSYLKRIPVIIKGIKSVLSKIKNEDVIIYVFGLDIAMWLRLLDKKYHYIFEESDLYHTYLGNSMARKFFESIDKRVIKKSKMTVFTSEGFAQYHFGDKYPDNVIFIPNRLAVSVLNCKPVVKRPIDVNHLSIGFVGAIRFKAVMHFAKYFVSHFPQHEFHFFGIVTDEAKEEFDEIIKSPNCYYHGKFSTPTDLPEIYSKIDLVLSTYDNMFVNVRYAEPNKFYESLYYDTPIIVSENTFLGEKVRRYNSGYVINALDDDSIDSFVQSLTEDDIANKIASIKKVSKMESVDINKTLFERLESI